jgi:hypothetical protein
MTLTLQILAVLGSQVVSAGGGAPFEGGVLGSGGSGTGEPPSADGVGAGIGEPPLP